MKFTEFDIPENILKALKKMKFEDMTPIQEATYPMITEGKDICALAETGSGKTSACAIPLVQKVDASQKTIQGLVLVPTRELCLQYVDEISRVAAFTKTTPFAIYGGFDKGTQRAKLKHGVHILVATPGRLIDFLYDGTVNLAHVKCAILDEADELLNVGFFDDIKFIMSCILHEHQTLLFSATMAPDIKKLAHDCLRDPQHISLIQKRVSPKSIEHCFCYIHPQKKQAKLMEYFKKEKIAQAIIFCKARHIVDELTANLRKDLKDVEYIHAGLRQEKRSSIFQRFKKKKIQYLLATDVAGRGLDFSHVSHVINWNLPGTEQYTHRTGRAGRMGRKGTALSFVTKHDLPALKEIICKKKVNPVWIGEDPFNSKNKYGKEQSPKRAKVSSKKKYYSPIKKNSHKR